MHNPLLSSRALLAGLAFSASLAASISAQAADFTFSGQLVYNTDVVHIDFELGSVSDVQLWTDSWQAGLNFDPVLGLFNGSQALLQIIDDSDGSIATGPGYYDAGATLSQLAAGHYRLTLSAYSNEAVGPALANGFLRDGETPIAIANWNQPGYDINANDQKGGSWQVHVNGVAQAAVVPEPGSLALMLGGLLALAALARKRQG